jgi:hypothetical protein
MDNLSIKPNGFAEHDGILEEKNFPHWLRTLSSENKENEEFLK